MEKKKQCDRERGGGRGKKEEVQTERENEGKGEKRKEKKKEKSKEIHRGVTDSFINKNDIGPLQLVLWTHILSPGTIELTVAR